MATAASVATAASMKTRDAGSQRSGVVALTADLCAIALAIGAALLCDGSWAAAHWHDLVWQFSGAVAAWLVGAALLRHYDLDRPRRSMLEEGGAVTLLVGTVVAFGLLTRPLPLVHARPAADLLLLWLWPAALALRLIVFQRLATGRPRDALIVGAGPLAIAAAETLRRAKRFRVLGHLALQHDRVPAGTPVLGAAEALEAMLRRQPIDEVYLAGDHPRGSPELERVVHTCEQLGTPFALPAWTLRLERASPARRHHMEDGFVHFRCVDPSARRLLAFKHLFDLLAAAAALALLGPFLLLVAALVKLESPGPAFFRQPRIGQSGRPFAILKFRSMVRDAEKLRDLLAARNEVSGPVFKMVRDPRVTRLGHFLRKYSIDELPQLLNVLRGEMSVVGPRPPIPSEVAQYEPWQLRRLSVRPGLTCIWQVTGRSGIAFHDWMLLDLRYIDNWNLRSDFSLIARTVPAVVTGRGAS